MKIDSFDVNLSSSRTYTESHFQEITHEFSFVDLMDLKLEKCTYSLTELVMTLKHFLNL